MLARVALEMKATSDGQLHTLRVQMVLIRHRDAVVLHSHKSPATVRANAIARAPQISERIGTGPQQKQQQQHGFTQG